MFCIPGCKPPLFSLRPFRRKGCSYSRNIRLAPILLTYFHMQMAVPDGTGRIFQTGRIPCHIHARHANRSCRRIWAAAYSCVIHEFHCPGLSGHSAFAVLPFRLLLRQREFFSFPCSPAAASASPFAPQKNSGNTIRRFFIDWLIFCRPHSVHRSAQNLQH